MLQALESGVPYGAGEYQRRGPEAVRHQSLSNAYLTPPRRTATTYFFGPRDEFHTEGQRRTDFAVNYVHGLRAGRMQLFGQLQVLNVFNQFQLCACGSTVFARQCRRASTFSDRQAVLTPVTNPATFATFNPFTTKPVRGVNWDYGPNFGKPVNRFAYTTPRTYRVSFGIRF